MYLQKSERNRFIDFVDTLRRYFACQSYPAEIFSRFDIDLTNDDIGDPEVINFSLDNFS